MTDVILNFRSEREDITLYGREQSVEGDLPIPRVGEYVRLRDEEYRVESVLYDYGEGESPDETPYVWVTLAPVPPGDSV